MVRPKNKQSKNDKGIADVAETQDITAGDELRKRKGKKKPARASAAEADGVADAAAALDDVEPVQGESAIGETKKRSMAEATGEDQVMPASTAAGSDEVPPVDPRIIYVGGVKKVSADEIRNHFKQFGEIIEVRCPTITNGNITRPVGCAFVTFEKQKDADEALSLDRTMLCEKTIRVQRKLPHRPKPEKEENAPRKKRSKTKNDWSSLERRAATKKAIEKAKLNAPKEDETQAESKDDDAKKHKRVKRKVKKTEDAKPAKIPKIQTEDAKPAKKPKIQVWSSSEDEDLPNL